MKLKIQKELCINFKHLENRAVEPIDGDVDGLITKLNDNKDELAIAILGETSENGYNRIRRKHTTSKLPTYCSITSPQPEVEDLSMNVSCPCNNFVSLNDIDIDVTTEVIDGMALESVNLEEEEALLKTAEVSTGEHLEGAKLKGNYCDYVTLMQDKTKRKNRSVKEDEKAIVIDSIDGHQLNQ